MAAGITAATAGGCLPQLLRILVKGALTTPTPHGAAEAAGALSPHPGGGHPAAWPGSAALSADDPGRAPAGRQALSVDGECERGNRKRHMKSEG